jgi:DNA methyltransferase 1-associated protein 1
VEIKRLEQVEKRYRADRDDLMRTVMGLDSGLVELDQDHTEAILGVDKVCTTVQNFILKKQAKKRKRADEEVQASPAPNTKKQKEDAAHGEC